MGKLEAVISLTDGIAAVAFDLDGTIIDSAPDLAVAANRMLARLGFAALPEARVPHLIGAGVERFVARALAHGRGGKLPGPALQAQATTLFRQLYRRQIFERGRVYPGVLEALRTLAAAGVHLCCITNKESALALPLLAAARLQKFFGVILCADREVDRKPSPTLLLSACAQLGIEPARMLYVGDSRTDVLAARGAGCPVVMVDYGYHGDLPLHALKPDGVVADLRAITPSPEPPHAPASVLSTTPQAPAAG
jgi:phosphoglycolate phosphatase